MNRYYNKPIKYAILFSVFTFLLYLMGPYKYSYLNRTKTILLVVFSNITMYYGFKTGTHSRMYFHNRSSVEKDLSKKLSLHFVVKFLFWCSLVICIPQFIIYTKTYDFSFQRVLNNASLFFSDAHSIYAARHEAENATGAWKYINYIVVLLGPIYWAYTPIAIFLWRRLKTWRKVFTIIIWFVFLLQYLCTGTNVGFFDFIITIVCVVFVRKLYDEKYSQRRRGSFRFRLLIAVAVIIMFYIFDVIMGSRIGTQYLNGGGIGAYRYTFNYDNIIWRFIPNSLTAVFSYFARYLAEGYNGLSLCFSGSFQSTFGFGYSWFLLDEFKGIFPDLWNRTYNMQIDALFGFNYYSSWHTAYTWFANDVSFFGVPFILFFLFYSFGRAWRTLLEKKDLLSFLRFMLFVKFSCYISSNNQVFQNSNTFIAFWILALLSLTKHVYLLEEEQIEKI